ncbi:MAG: hypothetical protein LBH15_04755 [Treponema sp.]|nr:hypothetical protein [Treponema sp.]
MYTGSSGWDFVAGDRQLTTPSFDTATFAPTDTAINIVPESLEGFPDTDFYGNPRLYAGGVTAAGAVSGREAGQGPNGGTGNDIPGKPPQGTGIYIAGIYDADDYTDVACYWKLDWNITAENLAPQKLSDGSSSSWAADIAAGKNGIYVAGFYVSRDKTACYWHDDGNTIVKKDLSVPQGARYSEAFSVYLAADGLYFAGYVNIGTGNKACYWDSKGDIHILEDAGESYARDIAVDSGGKIYIAGEKNFFTGCLWIADSDGIRVVELSNASRAESIAIDSAKIYVGGRTANEKACYWTVENETVTSSRVYSSSGTTSNVYGITVNNSSVYCAGDDGGIACYWGPSGNKIFVRGNENDQRSRALGIAVDSYDNIHIAEGAGYIKIVGGVGGTPYVTDLGGGLEAIVVVE